MKNEIKRFLTQFVGEKPSKSEVNEARNFLYATLARWATDRQPHVQEFNARMDVFLQWLGHHQLLERLDGVVDDPETVCHQVSDRLWWGGMAQAYGDITGLVEDALEEYQVLSPFPA